MRAVCYSVFAFVLVAMTGVCSAQTVHVPGDYPTIQAAIDAGAAEVRVADGTYHERLVVTRDLRLLPEQSEYWPFEETAFPVVDSMVIEGQGFSGTPNVHVRGFHLLGPVVRRNGSGCGGGNTVIEGCRLDGGFAETGCPVSNYVLLRGCLIRGGVSVWGGVVRVVACTVLGGGVDVSVDGGGTISDNYITGPAPVGIRTPSGNGGVDIVGNTVLHAHTGIESRKGPIVGNVVRGCAGPGIRFTYSDVARNVVEDCRGDGYLLTQAPDHGIATGTLDGNVARRCRGHGFNVVDAGKYGGAAVLVGNRADSVGICGIHGDRSASLTANDNLVRSSGSIGIWIEGEGDATANVVRDAGGDGIRVTGVAIGNVVGRSGGDGVVTRHARGNTSYLNTRNGYFITGSTPADSVVRNIAYGNRRWAFDIAGVDAFVGCNDSFANGNDGIWGEGNLEVDPLFCDVSVDSVGLRSDSPLVDAAGCGHIGARGVECDAGAPPAAVAGAGDAGGTFDLVVAGGSPSRGQVALGLRLPHDGDARVEVFDPQGRRLETIASGRMTAGSHRLSWGNAAGPGVYFVRARADGASRVLRVALVR